VSRRIRAAGGVLWRPGGEGPEVAVIHRPRYDDWSLPKGKLARDEPHVVGALREIREETGYAGRAGWSLGETSYTVEDRGTTVPKTVRWWSVRAEGGTFRPNDEVDELRWLRPDDALDLLDGAEPLRRWAAVPVDSAQVLLVRHGSAGDSSAWDGPDELRPLDDRGRAQAELLTRVLACYRPVRVVTAPPLRCVETVRPLAECLGLPLELDPLVGEDGAPPRPEEHVVSLAVPGETVVVCSQRAVLARVLAPLAPELGPVRVRKGDVWALVLHREAVLDVAAVDLH
jgi:8-oxo-dGTP pyrophosphatase MutT (NUDIX family)/phosphohistidine phosphatase SixA